MKDKLTELWKVLKTKQLAKIFKAYMMAIGVEKWDHRKKDNSNSYFAESTCGNWNRVTCTYLKDSTKFAESDLEIVLRKEAGNYFIISRKNKRAFEVDHRGVVHYEEDLLKEIMEDHKVLFQKLLELVA